MVFQDGAKLFNLFVETKNYKDLAKNTKFVNQFKAYLRGINNFEELVYFFNKRDDIQSAGDVKKVFQSIFRGNKNADGTFKHEFFDVLNANNKALLTSLGIQNKGQFIKMINNIDSVIYEFIKVL